MLLHRSRYLSGLLFLGLWASLVFSSLAQNTRSLQVVPNPTQPPPAATASVTLSGPATQVLAAISTPKAPPPLVRVVRVESTTRRADSTLQLGDHIILRVEGLRAALRHYHRKPKELRLFVDEIEFPMLPEAVDTIKNQDIATVRFWLQRNTATESSWQLFYQVWSRLVHPAHFGVGFENGQLGAGFPLDSEGIQLELVRETELIWGSVFVAVLLGGLLYLCWRSNLVRDDVVRGKLNDSDASTIDLTGPQYDSVPFSLSKVQLVFWTFLIFSAYMLCYLVTGELAALPASLLGLLGVSLGSTLFSRSLTSNQVDSKGPLTANTRTAGFFRDILAEENRFSIARIQFLLFNLLVGLYFIRHVWRLWNMPNLDSGLLGLISISATGFLFGKSQEHPAPATGQNADSNAEQNTATVQAAIGQTAAAATHIQVPVGGTTIINLHPPKPSQDNPP